MSRSARIVVLNQLHHVTQRGNNRQQVFFEERDYVVFLGYLRDAAEKYGVFVYAYCLMPNHVHLVLKPVKEKALAKLCGIVFRKYATYRHHQNKGVGHLWQSRFYSCVMYGEHVVKGIRYVERNPVRAGMVKVAEDYKWSSVRSRLGISYKWVELKDIKEYINVSDWRAFLSGGEDEKDLAFLRAATQQGKVFASEKRIQLLEQVWRGCVRVGKRGQAKKEMGQSPFRGER